MKRVLMLLSLVLMGHSPLFPQLGQISGLVYSDYYWVAKNHNQDIEGRNGFWFRRIYLTYDQGLSDEFGMRLRLEMNSPGDFTSDSSLDPFVKDAYLKWERSNHAIYVGQSTSPTWGFIEQVWGYRSLERTVLDLHRFGSSRDVGFAAKGKFGQASRLRYHFMIGNGKGSGTETDQNKKLMLAVGYKLSENVTAEGYVDWDDRPGKSDRYTYQGFLSYQKNTFRAGVQFVNQTRQQGSAPNLNLFVTSFFTVFPMSVRTKGVVRVDRLFEPNPAGETISYIPFSQAAKSTFFLLAVDHELAPSVHFMPNIQLVFYDSANGSNPNADVIPRLTFFYNWKSSWGQ